MITTSVTPEQGLSTCYKPAITNKTPWSTPDLLGWLLPLCKDTTLTEISVELLCATPGTKRAEQKLFNFSGINLYGATDPKGGDPRPSKITLYLLSPKRAASRVDALGRMALVHDLEVHEALLPEGVVRGIMHAFQMIRRLSKNKLSLGHNSWDYRKHFFGQCDCPVMAIAEQYMPIIRGDTRIRTTKRKSIDCLDRELGWALNRVETYAKKLAEAEEQVQRLEKRIGREATRLAKESDGS